MIAHMISQARRCVNRSVYVLRVDPCHAPQVVDCSSFTQWAYGTAGISIPRLARDQHDYCYTYLPMCMAKEGDLIFRKCHYPRFKVCPVLDIGHVGLVTSEQTVIHASWVDGLVVEESIETYFNYKSHGLWVGRVKLEGK